MKNVSCNLRQIKFMILVIILQEHYNWINKIFLLWSMINILINSIIHIIMEYYILIQWKIKFQQIDSVI